MLVGRDKRKSGVSSTARPVADPGGMVLRRFGDGRMWTDSCRMVELSGVVVPSTAGQARSTGQLLLWRWTSGRWRRQPLRASVRYGTQSRYVAGLGHPALDVRVWCDVRLILGLNIRHTFFNALGVATGVA